MPYIVATEKDGFCSFERLRIVGCLTTVLPTREPHVHAKVLPSFLSHFSFLKKERDICTGMFVLLQTERLFLKSFWPQRRSNLLLPPTTNKEREKDNNTHTLQQVRCYHGFLSEIDED